jgi:spermidine/putrescine transport system ATP-binding protein
VGITFVYVTHDQSEALTMSDRIAVMNDGAVEQLADPREIYERPATAFVASFIGTSNLLSGQISAISGDVATVRLGDRGRVLLNGGGHRLGESVQITVRPEKIRILQGEPEGDVSAVPGVVSEVVYLGTYNSYAVTLDGGAEVTVFEQNAHDSTSTAERGDSVWLSWQPHHSYAIGS